MRLPRTFLMLLAVAAIALATANTATAETIFAYYPFDSETGNVTPDEMNDNDLTLGRRTTSIAMPTIDSGGMFGNALKTTVATGQYAQRDSDDPDFDTNYTKLSVSLWAKTSTWENLLFDQRFLTGKYNTGTNIPPTHGWQMNVKGDKVNPVVHQIQFGGYNSTDTAFQWVTTGFTTALDPEVFHHFVGTFDAAGDMCVYVDGMLAASATSTLDSLLGDNVNAFQVANRGNTAYSATSGGGFVGSIDDYAIATGDVLIDKQIALIHGLGRLAGVTMGDGDSVGGEIADVLAAYTSQDHAVAGGATWHYAANVGGGTTVGAIGGTVAGGDAFIVLGADGSGVTLVPEPSALALIFSALCGLFVRRR